MEFALFLANTLLIAWLIYWCLIMASRKPGTKLLGLFAYREMPPDVTPDAAAEPDRPIAEAVMPWHGKR